MRNFRSMLFIAALGVFLTACGGDSPTDIDDNDGEARVIKDDPSFAQDIFEIFQRRGCTASGCHGGGAAGLTLSSAAGSYTALVGVASNVTNETFVIPSDAANSYLVKKLEGTGAGARMPLGGEALDNIDLTNVKNWINQGAKNN